MADNIGNKVAKDYHLDVPPVQEGYNADQAYEVYETIKHQK